MTKSGPLDDELRAAVSTRRDLGPDYEDAIVESFLDKVDQQIDRRVEERLATASRGGEPRARPTDNQGLALAIVSLSLGVFGSIGMGISAVDFEMLLLVWLGIVSINVAFAIGRRRR
ncbi:hypothetical protein [Streptosporangium sp. KLBMP 9127]|nr:hypothetical protein [Streptosporangium sp. KLBMP 9127]